MIVGIGTDVVGVERFTRQAQRSPEVLGRLFRPEELIDADGTVLGWPSLAERFATKEAIVKALGVKHAVDWHDMSVGRGPKGLPAVELSGAALIEASRLGVASWRVSVARSAGFAIASVIAEGSDERDPSPLL